MDQINSPKTSAKIQETAKDFFGKACAIQPQENELPVITRNFRSPGCDLQSYQSPPANSGDIDALQLYRELRPSVALFKMQGKSDGTGKEPAGIDKTRGGSGVIAGKEGNSCLVITDDHVTKGVPQQHVKVGEVGVVLANGKKYLGSVITSDPARDLALVKIDTGAETETICKPAKFHDTVIDPAQSPELITIGQPYTSDAIYTSTGTASQIQKRGTFSNMIQPLPGEDANRDVLVTSLSIREGFSGGAVFDKTGTAVGVNDFQTSPMSSVSTPVTNETVKDLLSRRNDKTP